uniref:Uncharacterized protein n=1 Tax=Catagonus wagneri TaxID=51154 RepID=A0A8C3WKY9_9CETA
MVFIFQFVDVVYHTDRFADTEESLHPRDKSYLIMTCDLFNIYLYYFVEDFCIYVHQLKLAFVFFGSIFGFGIRVMMASQNIFGSVPSSNFWERLRRMGGSSSLYF